MPKDAPLSVCYPALVFLFSFAPSPPPPSSFWGSMDPVNRKLICQTFSRTERETHRVGVFILISGKSCELFRSTALSDRLIKRAVDNAVIGTDFRQSRDASTNFSSIRVYFPSLYGEKQILSFSPFFCVCVLRLANHSSFLMILLRSFTQHL